MKNQLIIFLTALYLLSCSNKTGKIQVTNRVGSCRIENISFGNYKVPGTLITNEATSDLEIKDKKSSFPKKNFLKFYMVSQGNRVLLRTREEYELKAGARLDIVIESATEVTAP